MRAEFQAAGKTVTAVFAAHRVVFGRGASLGLPVRPGTPMSVQQGVR